MDVFSPRSQNDNLRIGARICIGYAVSLIFIADFGKVSLPIGLVFFTLISLLVRKHLIRRINVHHEVIELEYWLRSKSFPLKKELVVDVLPFRDRDFSGNTFLVNLAPNKRLKHFTVYSKLNDHELAEKFGLNK